MPPRNAPPPARTCSCWRSASRTTRRGAATLPAADGFLNVDLELGARTRAQRAPLLEALDSQLSELFRGRIRGLYRAHYETLGCHSDASTTIRALAAVIQALGPRARRAWNAAAMRDFNVGVELAPRARSIELAIAPDAIRQVGALGGRIAFTAYRGGRSARA